MERDRAREAAFHVHQRHGRDLPLVTSGAVLWQKGCRPGVSARKSPTARSPQPGRGREAADTAPRAQDLHNRAPGLGRGDFTTVPGQARSEEPCALCGGGSGTRGPTLNPGKAAHTEKSTFLLTYTRRFSHRRWEQGTECRVLPEASWLLATPQTPPDASAHPHRHTHTHALSHTDAHPHNLTHTCTHKHTH